MIPRECKRLAEVDFPIADVSRHAAKEKYIHEGHPKTLHMWWARRPLASTRSMLLALLLPDPCDDQCPVEFKKAIRPLLRAVGCEKGETNTELRAGLLKFIADFANWDLAGSDVYTEVSRSLIRAAYDGESPLVTDPFAGGGSIPLEALRLGCDAFASDLNPVACFNLRVLLEDIPRLGQALASDLCRVGESIQERAERELAAVYPVDPDGAKPIAYLWARTVRCEAPDCGAEIPIYKTPWLSKTGASRARYFREAESGQCTALLIKSAPRGGPVEFRVARGEGRETPDSGFMPLTGSKAAGNNANVVCPCCHSVLSGNKKSPRVPEQLAKQRGGADVVFDDHGKRRGGARMLAVVTVKDGEKGRRYRVATEADYDAVYRAQEVLSTKTSELQRCDESGLRPVPDEQTPVGGGSGASRAFSVRRYGMEEWGDLFTSRQKVALLVLLKILRCKASDTLLPLLACAFNRVSMSNMSCTRWNAAGQKMQHTFGRQALPIVWDFAEVVVTAQAPGNWTSGFQLVADVVARSIDTSPGLVQLADATNHPLPDQTTGVWFTDPPYYDAIPYADLSDFFLVWLKRSLVNNPLLSDPFNPDNPLSPKSREAIQDDVRSVDGQTKDRQWFEQKMAAAFAEGRRVLDTTGVGAVVFAHKTTEGWEALLSGMIRAGWTITASWPLATELATRLRARDSAALATSVHLICRPRPDNAGVGDWASVLHELPVRVSQWIKRLQSEGIRGADLVFACIGPALEVYSRYEAVETADGRHVGLPEFLEKVWEVVSRAALQQVLDAGNSGRDELDTSLEEDARLTALFLWTLQSTATEDDEGDNDDEGSKPAPNFSLPFDVVRRFAQPMGIDLEAWSNRVISQKKGVVRLMPVADRSKVIFGDDGASSVGDWLDGAQGDQPMLFDDVEPRTTLGHGGSQAASRTRSAVDIDYDDATTLDRLHAAMLLQRGGNATALRTLIDAEQHRGPDFLRLANALSALYPRGSTEKRLLDAMLLAVPR